jgi:acyl-CoA thioester hydrolase
MGIVHHAKYLEYFEIGRTEYMRARGHSYANFEKSGLFLVIIEAHIEYKKPATYDMEITIRTRVRDFSHTRVTFEYNIESDKEMLCEGWTTLACTDRNGKPKRIPENLREALGGDGQ